VGAFRKPSGGRNSRDLPGGRESPLEEDQFFGDKKGEIKPPALNKGKSKKQGVKPS
jgi:hypothetical protein